MINEFKGEYRFLSNLWMCPVQYEGYIYPSSEHAYMAAKTTDGVLRRQIANCPTPADAKKMGRKVQLRDGWEGMKQSVMQEILLDKFKRNTNLTQLLLATGDQQLVEGNWWGDKIWGVCLKTNQGQNLLGKTLMIVRDLLNWRHLMPIRQPSKAEVDALVQLTGEGRMHCNKELRNYFQREHLKKATSLEEVKEVLLTLLPTVGSYVHIAVELAEYAKKEDQ